MPDTDDDQRLSVGMTFRLPLDEREAFRLEAEARALNRSEVLRRLLRAQVTRWRSAPAEGGDDGPTLP